MHGGLGWLRVWCFAGSESLNELELWCCRYQLSLILLRWLVSLKPEARSNSDPWKVVSGLALVEAAHASDDGAVED